VKLTTIRCIMGVRSEEVVHRSLLKTLAKTVGVVTTLLVGSTVAHAEEPSPWSDSERLGDLVYFGVYGGPSFASVDTRTHHSAEDGTRSELDGLDASIGWTAGYNVAWWPYDFFGLDGSLEGFSLSYEPAGSRFDDCAGSDCRLEKTPSYDGFGLQVGPTVRGAIPLRYVQPNLGVGLMLPITFQLTQDPVSRLDETAVDVGAAMRFVGGLNVLAARDWRVYTEYHLDYRLVAVNPGAPLDDAGWLRHSIVLGFAVSPDSYKESPGDDKAFSIVMPLVLPMAGWIASAVAKGVAE